MAITPLSNSALLGIRRGIQGLRKSAAEIASSDNLEAKFPTKDLVRSMVELRQHELHTAASVKAFQTSDRMIGSLLDVKA